uniref:Uncharacterized protein n=1 Tax=Sphaerodactylus townsendi TaxID=933632 RepID=A0ACB8FHZ4_9SAUR
MSTSAATGGDDTLRVEPVLPLEPDLTGSDSLPDPLEGPRVSAGFTVASGGELPTTSYLEAPTRFLSAPLDASQGVTVRRRRNAEMLRDSLPWGTSSATWATAPLAGNLSGSDRAADRADASDTAAWRILQASEEAWGLEREEFRRTMQQMQLTVWYRPTELVSSRCNLPRLHLGCRFNHNHLFRHLLSHLSRPLSNLYRLVLRSWLQCPG